jgi:hypothetical protein
MRAQLREGRGRLGRAWPAKVAVNARAQSGLALIHILAALGYDSGLHMLLPLGADLELQVGGSLLALHPPLSQHGGPCMPHDSFRCSMWNRTWACLHRLLEAGRYSSVAHRLREASTRSAHEDRDLAGFR